MSKTWRGPEKELAKQRVLAKREAGNVKLQAERLLRSKSYRKGTCTCSCHAGDGGVHHNQRCRCNAS